MTRLAVCVAVFGFAMAGCGPSQGHPESQFQPCPMPQGGNYTGHWYTNSGEMDLEQSGSTVTGSWDDTVAHKEGHIEGTVDGCLLYFSWTQDDNTVPGHPRRVGGRGVLRYFREGQDTKFEGTWGYDQEVEGGGLWTGRRRREGM
jgi:hypothetical protein